MSLGALLAGAGSATAETVVPERQIGLVGALDINYQSNILRLPDDFQALPGQSRSDVRYTPSLAFTAVLPVGRQALRFAATAGYDFHVNNEQLDGERYLLSAGADFNVSRCSGSVVAEFSRAQSNLADLLGDIRVRNVENRTMLGGNLGCGGTIGLRPVVGYTYEKVENESELRNFGNFEAQTVTAGVAYVQPSLGEISLNGNYQKSDYNNRNSILLDPGGVEGHGVNLTIRRQFGSQITGVASIGATWIDPTNPNVSDFSGLSYSADVTYRPGGRLQLAFGASREAEQSNLLNVSYSIVDSYRIQADYVLSERVRLALFASHIRRDLRGLPVTPNVVIDSDDNTTRLGATATLLSGRLLSFALTAEHERRRSELRLFDYDNNSVSLSTRLSF